MKLYKPRINQPITCITILETLYMNGYVNVLLRECLNKVLKS